MAGCFCRGTSWWSQHRDNPLSTALPQCWLWRRIFWQRFGLLSKFFNLLWYTWIITREAISGKLLVLALRRRCGFCRITLTSCFSVACMLTDVHCYSHLLDISCHCLYLQMKNGFQFESETDTEIIPKLLKMINDTCKDDDLTFRELVERAVQQLVSYCWTLTFFIPTMPTGMVGMYCLPIVSLFVCVQHCTAMAKSE